MHLKEYAEEQRPRERLMKSGAAALSDAEVLALILKIGNREENVIELSQRLIARYGIEKLSSCSLNELQQIKGIGKAKACEILAAFELAKRARINYSERKFIRSPLDVFRHFQAKLGELKQEQFYLLLLDTKNFVTKEELIAIGTLNASIIHPREVFKPAIKESAYAVVMVHNHPSGDPNPSTEDLQVTEKLAEAGELLGIKLVDHVIIGNGKYWSWKEKK